MVFEQITTTTTTATTTNMQCAQLCCMFCFIPFVWCSNAYTDGSGKNDFFQHSDCTKARASQFQLDNCQLPAMNTSLALHEASFLMSHNAATGYASASRLGSMSSMNGATNLYAKTQRGSIYQQLQDGARALDVRPKVLQNGTVVCHHGALTIDVSLEDLLKDALRWVNENPSELVLILHMEASYERPSGGSDSSSGSSSSSSSYIDVFAAVSQVYELLGIPYVGCDDVQGLTVGDAMALADLKTANSQRQGYLLAMDRQDTTLSSCAKMNWISNQIVTCYGSDIPCTAPTNNWKRNKNITENPALERLHNYVLQSTNGDPSDSRYSLGPPASWDYYPLTTIQALWQVDTHAAANGVAHLSSIFDDNTKSHLHQHVVEWIYNQEFHSINLLMLDQVQLNGNAVLSVLRTSCGQRSSDSSDVNTSCGQDLSIPGLQKHKMTKMTFTATMVVWGLFGIWFLMMVRHYQKYYRHEKEIELLQKDVQDVAAAVGTCGTCGISGDSYCIMQGELS